MSLPSEAPTGKKVANVILEFGAKNLTGFAGLVPFAEFLKRLGAETVLNDVRVQWLGRRYPVGRLLLAIILGFVAGLNRLCDVAALRLDKVILKALGWGCFPVQSTISRFLWRFRESTVESLAQAGRVLLERFRQGWKNYRRIHLDLDSHVRTVYGNTLEGAKRGYNPHKRGRLSYHPLLAFVGETRDFLHGFFRPGNTTQSGAVNLLNRCLDLLGFERFDEVVVRADSGFCFVDFIDAIEMHPRTRYVISLKIYRYHQRRFCGLNFRPVKGSSPEEGLEIAAYYSSDWPDQKQRRIIVIRQMLPEDPAVGVPGKQLALFELKGYAYRALVTNLNGEPEDVWREYNGRACAENFIKEGIAMGLDVNATRRFNANAAHFHLVMIAYNLLNWYKEFAIAGRRVQNLAVGRPVDEKPMHKQIVRQLLSVPGSLATSGRQMRLKLPVNWPWRHLLESVVERLLDWRPVWA